MALSASTPGAGGSGGHLGVSNFPRWLSSMPTMPVYPGASRLEIRAPMPAQAVLDNRTPGRTPEQRFDAKPPHGARRDIRLWNWMAVACGANGILY